MTIVPAVKSAGDDHVVIFPFLAKGHTIPLLHLASALSSRNILVSFITTPAAVPFLRDHLTISSSTVRFLVLPFPSHPDLPVGVETTDALPSFSLFPAFLAATTSLKDPFHLLLRRLILSSDDPPPLCLVSDFFLWWTLPICRRFGLPRIVFHGMPVFSMALCKSLWNNSAALSAGNPIPVPGAPPALRLNLAEIPEEVRNSVDQLGPAAQFLNVIHQTDVASWGVIVNSFPALEPPAYVELLDSFYGHGDGGRSWLVGPLILLSGDDVGHRNMKAQSSSSSSECIRWLDRQPAGSVVYVAFGTQASISGEQLDELAYGLAKAGVRYLWAVRSEAWVPPVDPGELGRIERGWVPQKEVLSHASVGGFLSHCGWNSVLEAVAAGVAVLAFPMIAEQHLNAKLVAEEIGIGLRLFPAGSVGVVGWEEIEEGVRELMEGEKGRRATKTAAELAKKARAAVSENGSAYQALEMLLDELRKIPKAAAAAAAAEVDGVFEGDQA
ncbi:UDP-glycosyltransferase 90A1 [Platanthera guangdongensis]|uniref:UDP-glycosyltransferase 90A1 n=1 Tax=Platanthera guangdongensis TaxID=2320717 RepID=A0ABR2LYU9_9ASPA